MCYALSLCEFVLGMTHLAYFVLLSNCMGWRFYYYAFHFNKRLRQTDRFWKPRIRKPRCWFCPFYKIISQTSCKDGGQGWTGLAGLKVSVWKDWWPNSHGPCWSRKTPKLYLGFCSFFSSLNPWRELWKRSTKAKPKSWLTCKYCPSEFSCCY